MTLSVSFDPSAPRTMLKLDLIRKNYTKLPYEVVACYQFSVTVAKLQKTRRLRIRLLRRFRFEAAVPHGSDLLVPYEQLISASCSSSQFICLQFIDKPIECLGN